MSNNGLGNTHVGAKVSICATPQSADLADAAAFAALVYLPINNVGRFGAVGRNQNMLSYPVWNGAIAKAKGNLDGGSPELEVGRDTADAGQDALRAAGLVNLPYAFVVEMNDKLTVGGTNTKRYYRALVAGPSRTQGQSEDFDVEVFTLGVVQIEVISDPT